MNAHIFEDLDEEEACTFLAKRNRHTGEQKGRSTKQNRKAEQHIDFFQDIEFQDTDSGEVFDFFVGEGIIAGEGPILKQGKEAIVYRCPGSGDHAAGDVAVKMYKNIEHRSFQALSHYLQGRLAEAGINRRDSMHIVSTPSELQAFWVYSEYSIMERLFREGFPVPRPLAKSGTALAMEFIADDTMDYGAAPRLRDYPATPDETRSIKRELLDAIKGMLALNIIHGDLSPYNVLVRQGRPLIIDFPQAIDARYNARSRETLYRDILNICRWAPDSRHTPQEEATAIERALWEQYPGK